jgi:hypothetical protein
MLHNDDDGKSDFVSELLNADMLEGTSAGIAKLWLDKGEHSLSPKQLHIFEKYVLEAHDPGACIRGCDIPWSEKFEALDNGGMCSYCAHMADKIMRE